MKQVKTILITGSGSGIGRDTALALARRGHTVIATTETEEQAIRMKATAIAKQLALTVFKLDVTSEEDRLKATHFDIDVLINNAGTGESGSLAEIDVQKVRHNYEVNVFGPLALTQLVLKNMMKKDSGTIVIISSLLGRITMPFLAPYSMTKFSLSCAGDALRQELRNVTKNVHVCLVEPSGYHTGFNQANIAKKFEWMDDRSYFHSIIPALKKKEETYFKLVEAKSTDSIVRRIVSASEARKPRLRYVAPWFFGFGVQLLRIFGK